MPYFQADEHCRIYYELHHPNEAKPTVVFLNGTAQTAPQWIPISSLLKERFQVLAYDARGQGRSDLGNRGLSLEGHAQDLRRLLEFLGFPKVHAVGLSHGARVALTFARLCPERVERLVLCSSTVNLTCRSRLALKLWLETLLRADVEAMARAVIPLVFGEAFLKQKAGALDNLVRAIAVRNNKDALVAHLRAGLDYAPPSQMDPSWSIPTLVLSGSDDFLAIPDAARELAALCGGEHRLIRGAGHSIPAEAPEAFAGCLLEFLT